MKTLLVGLIALSSFTIIAQTNTSGKTCLNILNKRIGSPFTVANKKSAIQDTLDNSELDDAETAKVINLLKRADTEAYIPYDSSDAGAYLHIVKVGSCKSLWSGFVYGI
jgi:hypothetical protein